MTNTYKSIHILELNDAQVLNLANYYFNDTLMRLESLEEYMHEDNAWSSNASNVREALQVYLNECNNPFQVYYLFDEDSYVWNEKEYTLEKEEDGADYIRVELVMFNNKDSYCHVYPSLGRIVHRTLVYDGLSCIGCEKHRIGNTNIHKPIESKH